MTAAEWSDGAAGPLLRLLDDVSSGELAWMDFALCAEIGGDLHFPEKGGDVRAAKQVCMACEVRESCLQYALDHSERHGLWGGKSERQRRSMKRRTAGGMAA
jgi:WhiB family transcriptional regulator, redox-sensing transcriptional regulator